MAASLVIRALVEPLYKWDSILLSNEKGSLKCLRPELLPLFSEFDDFIAGKIEKNGRKSLQMSTLRRILRRTPFLSAKHPDVVERRSAGGQTPGDETIDLPEGHKITQVPRHEHRQTMMLPVS
ncbi:hypothetical protein [Sinorhizobium sp. BG8]|uniref:hypothetical protein n=1 Tax=Sinorhizobium sp. BG8 TaxID=2613773 RepID=UPI00193D136F|nr:hypothetical protein [Sinorhizobium sp. BG8]QRM56520.1 hypothetical protein F3Y30_19765 [Sinorhizobium sp. BG8]